MSTKKRFRVWATVTGSTYLGEFEAATAEEAIKKASREGVSFCHHCTSNCEDPELSDFAAEEERTP